MTTTGCRVLVVEDNSLLAMFIEDCLQDAGYEVVGVEASLRTGPALATTVPLDAAVLDVNLRGEISSPIADALLRRNIPFIICSAYDAATIRGLPAGVPRLSKPLEPQQLTAALAAAIRLRRRPSSR